MTKLRRLGHGLLAGLVLLAPLTWVWGGVVPGRWEKLEAQAPGTPIRLTLRSGEERVAIFQGATRDELRIYEVGGKEMLLPKSSVAKVESRYKVPDRTGDGIAIGVTVGTIWGAVASGAGDFSRVETIVFTGLMGAGVGYLIDKSLERPETLFQSR